MAEARSDDVPARVQELVDALCADAERAPGFGEPISSSELFLKISWKRFTTAIPTHCHARPCAPTYRYSARATELNARFGTPPVAELAWTGFVSHELDTRHVGKLMQWMGHKRVDETISPRRTCGRTQSPF